MTHQSCIEKLADIRADIARLKLREAALETRFLKDPLPPAQPRPGWPIHRKTAAELH